MKKLLLPILLLCIAISFFSSCKKNYVDEHYTPIVNPVIPDFTTQVNAGVNGFITDENGNAVAGASVKAGTVSVISDQFGYFTINNASFAKSAGFVQISKSGYFTGYRTFLPVAGKEIFIRLQLIPKTNTGTINSTAGGIITTPDGATITLPADAVVNASTNTAYTGTINVAAHWLDPSAKITQQTMPGNLTGVDSAGHLNVLVTYGMLAVELTGSGGETLQIAPGKKASLHFPLPASLSGIAPASIPLWYFDETKGVWKQEGAAVKNGNSYEGDVNHFTFWNCDIGYSPVTFTVQLLDSALRPLSNIEVSIRESSHGSYNHGYTDTAGYIHGMVPANTDLIMYVDIPCSSDGVRNIHSTNSAIDLGSIQLNLQNYAVSFKGVVNKCNGSPVTNGFVICSGAQSFAIKIHNGVFNATTLMCLHSNLTVTAIDNESLQQSSPQNIITENGINDFGILSACTNLTQYLTYTLDTETQLFTLPYYRFECGYFISRDVTQIEGIDNITGNGFSVDIPGGDTVGNHQMWVTAGIIGISNMGRYMVTSPMYTTITQYGLIGQFISGHFTGTVVRLEDYTIHNLTFSFLTQRSF